MRMKIRKWHVVLLALVLGMVLSACGGFGEKDITLLVQGNIDAIYLGKYDPNYLELVDDTEEGAERDYLDGLEVEADYFSRYWGIVDTSYGESYEDLDESLRNEIVELYKDIYSYSKYEVRDAVKQSDGTYTVKVLVEPIDIMRQASELYDNDGYEPLNEFWERAAQTDFSAMSDEEYMAYTHEYGEIIVQMVRDLLPNLGYGEQKSQVIQVEKEDSVWRINEDDWGIFDTYVIDYP